MISLVTVVTLVLGGLLFICCLRTFRRSLRSKRVQSLRLPILIESALDKAEQRADDAVNRFSKALQFKTVSTSPHIYDRSGLRRFVDFIEGSKIIFTL